jgi:hypothetical protein
MNDLFGVSNVLGKTDVLVGGLQCLMSHDIFMLKYNTF